MSTTLPLPTTQGAVWDVPAHALPVGVWSDIVNARVRDGQVQSLRGATVTPSAVPLRYGSRITLSTGVGKVLVYSTKITQEINGNVVDVTCTDVAFTDSAFWQLSQFGDSILLVSPDMHPLFKSRTDAKFRKLPGWPVNDRAKKIVAYSNILVAINVVQTGVSNPTLVVWSNPVDPEDTSTIIWVAAPTNSAGENPIASAAGELIDAVELSGGLFLYFRLGVWRMTFIGGGFVFSFVKVFSDDGVLGPQCVVDLSDKDTQRHLVLGFSGIYEHNGISKNYLGEEVQQDYLMQRMDTQKRGLLVHFPSMFEVWLITTTQGGGFDFGFIYNYRLNKWSSVDLQGVGGTPLTWMFCSYVVPVAAATWNTVTGAWRDYQKILWNFGSSGLQEQMFGLTPTSVTAIDDSRAPVSSAPAMLLERDKIDLDELQQDDDLAGKIKQILRVLPQITGTGPVFFKFGSRATLNAPVEFIDEAQYDIVADYKVDARPPAGRYLYLRVRTPVGTRMLMSKLGFAVELLHAR